MKTHQSPRDDFFWPLALLSVLAMALLIITAFLLVRQFDIAAKAREQTVVANGIVGRTAEIRHMVVTQVVWDDAVRNLDNRFDEAWARQNIAEFLHTADGFAATFILDRSDAPVFAAERGRVMPVSAYAPFAAVDAEAVKAVRAAEARRGRITAKSQVSKTLADPIQSGDVAFVAGRLYIVTATLVQPDFGESLPSGPRSPIVIAAMPVDAPFLATLSKRFMLRDLHVHNGDSRAESAEAHAAFRNAQGAVVATLDWAPQTAGMTLLRRLISPILFVVACLGLVALMFYRRSRRMAQGLIASEARAAHLAYHDGLTGLPNRVLFFDRLGHALGQIRRSRENLAVLCIDLDRFKEVNDTFGHHVGDALIQEAGRRMSLQCRAADTIARLSGDEFAIVQSNATATSAAALATRLIECIAKPFDLGAGQIYVGCSVGISIVREAELEPAEALRQADLALYRAKTASKGQFCFFEMEMDAAVKTRRALERDLRDALANDDLQLVYQPQVNRAGIMIGVEALVRWRHAERGDISPAFFVPIAEECGLIAELGMFTLRRAFEDSRRWSDLKVAVNVSANQLRMKDFVPKVAALVESERVDPGLFELEITEGILLGDDPETQETLRRLRAMGFSLALDDFGTGYSSLSYLQRYPINKIKIDRSFIANLGVEAESDAVIGAIVKLARALKMSVIAEGVETADQRDRLAAAGCSEVQGFLFSRPVGAHEIDRLSGSRMTALLPKAA